MIYISQSDESLPMTGRPSSVTQIMKIFEEVMTNQKRGFSKEKNRKKCKKYIENEAKKN